MTAHFSKTSPQLKERKINSVFLLNDQNQLVQIRYDLVRIKTRPRNFIQKIFGKKRMPRAMFVGNQETPQTRAANKYYYEKVLKLKEGSVYRIKDILYEDLN